MFLILKGKRQMKAWFDFVEDKEAYIAVSENGWTYNIIGLGSMLSLPRFCIQF